MNTTSKRMTGTHYLIHEITDVQFKNIRAQIDIAVLDTADREELPDRIFSILATLPFGVLNGYLVRSEQQYARERVCRG